MNMATALTLRAVLAAGLLGLTACTGAPGTTPTTDIKDSPMTTTPSCTGVGSYRVVPSAVGPIPGLPQSAKGARFTPNIGLAGTDIDSAVPTVNLVVWAEEPKPSIDETFKGLAMGDEVTFRGYTLKISSICVDSAQFELTSQQE
ncbi:hypothetical protein ACX80E_13355 [Arthrobacter sp. TMN-49]